MSVEVSTRVWKYSEQRGTALLILLALADWADDWGYCYPGHKAIAEKVRTTERNVYMLMKKMVKTGELRIIRQGTGGRNKITSIYQVVTGMSSEEIIESERLSPIAVDYLLSPENISPEKISPEISRDRIRQYINAVNIKLIKQQQFNDVSPEKISPEKISGEKSSTEISRELPQELIEKLQKLGWRGSIADVEHAWNNDPERVRQWLWYAKSKGMSAPLLRTVLRNEGEYPPKLDPNSEAALRRYVEGEFADYIGN